MVSYEFGYWSHAVPRVTCWYMINGGYCRRGRRYAAQTATSANVAYILIGLIYLKPLYFYMMTMLRHSVYPDSRARWLYSGTRATTLLTNLSESGISPLHDVHPRWKLVEVGSYTPKHTRVAEVMVSDRSFKAPASFIRGYIGGRRRHRPDISAGLGDNTRKNARTYRFWFRDKSLSFLPLLSNSRMF